MTPEEKECLEIYEKGYGDGAADACIILLLLIVFVSLMAG